ncbi:MAG TPA: ubiquinol-cytochrome c reductase iron-sulfur subunit [Acidimicrobiales bacterium]
MSGERPGGGVSGERPEDALGETVPVWRQDFPFASEGEDDVTRREFVRFLMLGSGAFAAGTVGVAALTSARGEADGDEQEVVALGELRVAAPHLFSYPTGKDPAILLLRPDGELAAYSQKCTHLGCVVYLNDEGDELVCPCHEGGFSPDTGDVLFGPPQRPLPRISVEVRDGVVWATGVDHG